jgi:outer membrane cobalamin receptor
MWHAEVGRFQAGVSMRYLGSRYTDEINSRATQLPEVLLWDIYGGCRFEKAEGSWEWRIRLDNIANVQYQEVRSYAMPGRVIGAQLSYTLHHKS